MVSSLTGRQLPVANAVQTDGETGICENSVRHTHRMDPFHCDWVSLGGRGITKLTESKTAAGESFLTSDGVKLKK